MPAKKKVVVKAVKAKKKELKTSDYTYDVVIIGGGPAGLMAGCKAGEDGQKVLIIEKNLELGRKLLMTGGGRCNLTNANPNPREFVSKFGKKGDLLFSPLSVFGVKETIKFFNDLGLPTKIEPGFRVFPISDNSADVLDVLVRQAEKVGVEFKLATEVIELKLDKKEKIIKSVLLKDGTEITARKFILTTGGLSHPETGSTGDGFKWLKDIGHKVAEANPSLVPVKISDSWISELSGITLDNVGISVWQVLSGDIPDNSNAEYELNNKQNRQKVLAKKGRVLFTHVGLSGPTILNMSKSIGEVLEYSNSEKGEKTSGVLIYLDFFPGIGLDQMNAMMKQTFEENKNKKVKNLFFKEIPTKIFNLILKQLEIDPEWEINEVTREERFGLIDKFKKFELNVSGLLGFDKAIISSGGLDLTEIDFKTMGSKLYSNLYLAGDVLDFDRPSGGFSLQLCWTTGYIAGKSSSRQPATLTLTIRKD